MKQFLFAAVLFIAQQSSAQNPLPQPLPVSKDSYFLTANWMKDKGLELNDHVTTPTTKRWSSFTFPDGDFPMLFDIRFTFKNEKDAALYFMQHMEEMGEGDKPTVYSLKSLGASQSVVYSDEAKTEYNFIFRIKKVVAKIFVSVSKTVEYTAALEFAKQAIKVINAAK